jgi:hypothetical protein
MQNMNKFDPYYSLLDIPPQDQPPDYYRLLSINRREENTDVIEAAADRRMELLKPHEAGNHMHEVATLLSEVSRARLCLTDPTKKASYDASLIKSKGDEADLYDTPSSFSDSRAKRKRLLVGILIGGAGLASIVALLVLVSVIRTSDGEVGLETAANKSRKAEREKIANNEWSTSADKESNLPHDVTDGHDSTSDSTKRNSKSTSTESISISASSTNWTA